MIYAVDFDGTLCKSAWPDIGEANTALIEFLKREKADGAELILWTMRESWALLDALYWCEEHGLQFDAVNDNLDRLKEQFHNNPRKVYADCYIDDHNYGFRIGDLFNESTEFFEYYAKKYGRDDGRDST